MSVIVLTELKGESVSHKGFLKSIQFDPLRQINPTLILEAWTNFSWQDKTWAEFSTLEVAAFTA